MRAIRSEDTGPERALRSALWRMGLRFHKHDRRLPGRPDVSFPRLKLAVFVDGDFWHGRAWRETDKLPEANRDFWQAKFRCNASRDAENDAALVAMGWEAMRIWESDIAKDMPGVLRRMADMGLEPRLLTKA